MSCLKAIYNAQLIIILILNLLKNKTKSYSIIGRVKKTQTNLRFLDFENEENQCKS